MPVAAPAPGQSPVGPGTMPGIVCASGWGKHFGFESRVSGVYGVYRNYIGFYGVYRVCRIYRV